MHRLCPCIAARGGSNVAAARGAAAGGSSGSADAEANNNAAIRARLAQLQAEKTELKHALRAFDVKFAAEHGRNVRVKTSSLRHTRRTVRALPLSGSTFALTSVISVVLPTATAGVTHHRTSAAIQS